MWCSARPAVVANLELSCLELRPLAGGAFDDTLSGLGGNDRLFGNAGNDALDGGLGDNTAHGGAGNDLLRGREGSDALQGGAGDDELFGSLEDDVVDGGSGNDTLNGGKGESTLSGDGGDDTFLFDTRLVAGAITTITDLAPGDDTIALGRTVFTAIGAVGPLADGRFCIGAGAHDAGHRIVYNAATGALLRAADGSGAQAATHFATLTPGLALSARDLAVIA